VIIDNLKRDHEFVIIDATGTYRYSDTRYSDTHYSDTFASFARGQYM